MKLIQNIFTIILFSCLGGLSAQNYKIGDLYTAQDGSKGIVYYVFPEGNGGWVVALADASAGCMWGTESDIPGMINQDPSSYYQQLLIDTAGYANTQVIRSFQNNNTLYAAGKVDFDHGWILPSPAQLYILYGKLPLITNAINAADGLPPTNDHYWCSAERNVSSAWSVSFNYGLFEYVPKTSSICRVRAVRTFTYTDEHQEQEVAYTWNTGDTTPDITVNPTQTTTYTVTVSNSGGCADTVEQTIVVNPSPDASITAPIDVICVGTDVTLQAESNYETSTPIYPFPSVVSGDILCTDNSIVKPANWPVAGKTAKGIVFYVDNTGEHGWAVHLQDQSTGVVWGEYGTDIPTLTNYANSRAALTDFNGYNNTQRTRAAGTSIMYPAAYLADFANGWYIPAAGQLRTLFSELLAVNASLQTVGGTQFPMGSTWWYWSSTERNQSFMWYVTNAGIVSYNLKDYTARVRVIRSF